MQKVRGTPILREERFKCAILIVQNNCFGRAQVTILRRKAKSPSHHRSAQLGCDLRDLNATGKLHRRLFEELCGYLFDYLTNIACIIEPDGAQDGESSLDLLLSSVAALLFSRAALLGKKPGPILI